MSEPSSASSIPLEHVPSIIATAADPIVVVRSNDGELTIVGGNEAWGALARHSLRALMRRSPSVCMSDHLVARIAARAAGDDLRTRWAEPHPDDRVGECRVEVCLTVVPAQGQRFVIVAARPTTGSGLDATALQAVLDGLAHPVAFIDRRLRIAHVNAALAEITDRRAEELIGADARILVSDAEQREDLVGLLTAAGPSTTTVPVQLARRSGGAHAADASVRLVTGPVLGVVLDFRLTGGEPDGVDVDELTGLAGRTAFFDHVAELAARSAVPEVAVAFLDIDNFKTINDALGHDQGDVLLLTVAHRLRDAVGSGGLVARFGGDEFVVAMQGAPGHAHDLIEACIRTAFADPIVLENKPFVITSSVGVVTATDREQLRPEHLLKAADTAMYESKRRGKDRLTVYDESLHHEATNRLEMESDLRVALERGEFELHYQPIMDVVTGRPVGAEALLRWVHPERGMVRPDLFIPIAEATGLILPIGAWVLETAIAQAAEWNRTRRRRRALSISVNLSGHQLSDPDLEHRIHAALSRTGLDPQKLTLEVTESTLMLDRSGATDVLERIRGRGIGIAIDDFGTGYSSLAYLKRLPARTLKIDKAFVDGLGIQAEDTALVTGIVGLASALDLLIVAEGVETETQLKELRRLGCEYSQGYLHSRPLPADAFVAWLASVEPAEPSTTLEFERDPGDGSWIEHPRDRAELDELHARRLRREGTYGGY